MPQSPTSLQDDVITNQIALRNAEAQAATRSIARSFLGTLAGDDDDDHQVNDRNETNADEIPTSAGDLDGIGYVAPPDALKSDLYSRGTSAATEALRKQLLGRSATKQPRQGPNAVPRLSSTQRANSKRFPHKNRESRHDTDDEEGGRSSVGKQNSISRSSTSSKAAKENGGIMSSSQDVIESSVSKKRGSSYLDEVLAQRAEKKRQKQKQKMSKQG